jgi:glycosyltransferase involved in cell wall biosynthesis
MAAEIEARFTPPIVYIFQFKFFDKSGTTCFNGGAERYLRDLAAVLVNEGKTPILIQVGQTKLWERTTGSLNVIGIPIKNDYDFIKFSTLLRNYEFVIYSGYDDWGKKLHPNILISHGINWDGPDNDVRIGKVRKIISDVDHFVSVDTNTISWLRTTFSKSLLGKNMRYIPNYVDTDLYKPLPRKKSGRINITFPRRCSAERGYWPVSKVLPVIMEKYPQADFNFVGFAHGEKIAADLKSLAARFPNRIKHCTVEPDEMAGIYQQTDISLIPTLYSEGTSLSCIEAQACGNIAIATNVGGLPNLVIDGYNGFLINPNEHDLLNALDKAIANPDLCERISKNAVLVAKAFDKKIWEDRWAQLINIAGAS